MTHNFVVTDFKPVILNGKFHLSFIQQGILSDHETLITEGVILDANYDVVHRVNLTQNVDMHEFSVGENMESFLKISKKRFALADLHPDGQMIVIDNCVTEIDAQDLVIFEFCLSDILGYNFSFAPLPPGWDLGDREWDP